MSGIQKGNGMNEASIRKYALLMRELGLSGLEITEGTNVVRLERSVSQAAAPAAVNIDAPSAEPQEHADYISVRSPMIGVFYAAPAENADPYVCVGDRIQAGQTMCIIEAMKLMNEIPAEVSGEIMEICVKNGQAVDYGCELFRIRR